MDLTIDALGDSCPIPVVKAKKALATIDEGTVKVFVDNETAVHNLENLAKNQKCASSFSKESDDHFTVDIVKDAAAAEAAKQAAAEAAAGGKANPVVVISSETMGSGDDALGTNLMKAFIFALTQLDTLPATILLYNGGVHLSCEGSPALDDLKALAGAGVEILSCGTCLKHYDLTDKLAVGEVTNMYVIVEKQVGASVVVRP